MRKIGGYHNVSRVPDDVKAFKIIKTLYQVHVRIGIREKVDTVFFDKPLNVVVKHRGIMGIGESQAGCPADILDNSLEPGRAAFVMAEVQQKTFFMQGVSFL